MYSLEIKFNIDSSKEIIFPIIKTVEEMILIGKIMPGVLLRELFRTDKLFVNMVCKILYDNIDYRKAFIFNNGIRAYDLDILANELAIDIKKLLFPKINNYPKYEIIVFVKEWIKENIK